MGKHNFSRQHQHFFRNWELSANKGSIVYIYMVNDDKFAILSASKSVSIDVRDFSFSQHPRRMFDTWKNPDKNNQLKHIDKIK